MIKFLFLFLIIAFFVYLKSNKIKIKWKTFKYKGFKPVRGKFGVYVYCGKQGKGKTYSVVEYLIDNDEKIQVFSNIFNIKNVTDITYFTGFKELIELRDKIDWARDNKRNYIIFHSKKILLTGNQIVFVYDEIFEELRRGSVLNKEITDFLCQMRKREFIFLSTCQDWSELPLPFRKFCRYQIDCNMFPVFNFGLLIKVFHDAEKMKWSTDEQEHVAPIIETTVTKCRKLIAESYDTFLRISTVASQTTTVE